MDRSQLGSALTPHDIFSRVRLEQDQTPLFFVPSVLKHLELPRPRYLVGTRGSGKTSLLRAMHWKERLNNPSLRRQLGPDPFAERYIGVYLKIPEVQLGLLERWLADSDDDTMSGLFSTYLESAWLQLAARAVSQLVVDGYFRLEPELEWEALDDAVSHLDQFTWFQNIPSRLTLPSLRKLLARLHNHLEMCARRGVDSVGVTAEVPASIGLLGRTLGPALTSLCRDYCAPGQDVRVDEVWRFQVCLDEAESLSPRQQLTLNTMIRLSSSPVYYVASFVGRPADMVTTYKPNLTLASADLEVTNRDHIPPQEFDELVQGVVQGRADAVLGHGAVTVNLKSLLGQPSLNQLMAPRLTRTESKETAGLIDDARRWAATKANIEIADVSDNIAELPLWQAYAIRSRFGEIPAVEHDDVRNFESRFVRKFSTAAYLRWHRERHLNNPLYAGWEIFRSVADSCVRDFLWQMDALLATTSSADDEDLDIALRGLFARTQGYDKQSQALYQASDNKLSRITQVMTAAPEPGRQLVTKLGELLREVERKRKGLDAEAGLFQVRMDSRDAATLQAADLIRRSAEAGYLKLEVSDPVWTFRLHSSLAPHFRLSWRDAYRKVNFSAGQILDMATQSAADNRQSKGQRVSVVQNELEGQVELDFVVEGGDNE